METLREKVKHILKKDAERITDFVEDMYSLYPVEVGEMIDELYYGCHITSEKTYDEAVKLLKKPDGEYGAKWSVEDIARKSGIDFEKEDFTKHDFAYVVNMLYSDYGKKITDAEILMDMAEIYLTDDDYPGDPSERAYKNAKKRIRYFKEHNKKDE